MEVILIDKIKNLGDVGELVKVRPGYARNYLIPYGKAKFATEQNRLEIEQQRAKYEKHISDEHALAKEKADKLKDVELSFIAQAMEDGRLYGPINITEVSELVLQSCGVEIQKQEINFPQGQIRNTGSHPIIFHLHNDVQVQTQLQVIAAGQTSAQKNEQQESTEDEPSPQTPDAADTNDD